MHNAHDVAHLTFWMKADSLNTDCLVLELRSCLAEMGIVSMTERPTKYDFLIINGSRRQKSIVPYTLANMRGVLGMQHNRMSGNETTISTWMSSTTLKYFNLKKKKLKIHSSNLLRYSFCLFYRQKQRNKPTYNTPSKSPCTCIVSLINYKELPVCMWLWGKKNGKKEGLSNMTFRRTS